MSVLLSLQNASKQYTKTEQRAAIENATLAIDRGTFTTIQGPSGGGKSTLLNILGLLDTPNTGTYSIAGREVGEASEVVRAQLRSDHFAFIFQNFHLLDRRPVRDSVELGLLYRGVPEAERLQLTRTALASVGLPDYEDRLANALSGGQRQRVAIARALASRSPVVIADEPTGNLDSENTAIVMRSLLQLRDAGSTVLMVTHDPSLTTTADQRISIRDGQLTVLERRDAATAQRFEREVLGAASTVRREDFLRDAWRNLRSRLGRTLGLIVAVAVGVGLSIATLGISSSAQAQVSAQFDAVRNRDVTASWQSKAFPLALQANADGLDRLAQIRGVEYAAIADFYDARSVQTLASRPSYQVPTYGVVGKMPNASRMRVRWVDSRRLTEQTALIGAALATRLQLGPLAAHPTITVDGSVYSVAGLITDSPRFPAAVGAVFLNNSSAHRMLGTSNSRQVVLLAKSGAAQQVAKQLPYVVDPSRPRAVPVSAPVDPSQLRGRIENSVAATLIIVTLVALVGSIAGLANSMSASVMERKQEIGLRRALGALPRHIALLLLVEATIVGVLGGMAGVLGGLAVILGVTISQSWVPVFDLGLAPLGLLSGVIIGALGGLLASIRASRIEPSDALRQ